MAGAVGGGLRADNRCRKRHAGAVTTCKPAAAPLLRQREGPRLAYDVVCSDGQAERRSMSAIEQPIPVDKMAGSLSQGETASLAVPNRPQGCFLVLTSEMKSRRQAGVRQRRISASDGGGLAG